MSKQLTFTTLGGEVVTVQQRGKHYVVPRGYAYHPGSGPQGETCSTCAFIARLGRYRKCKKYREFKRWTHGPATDILARSPACKYWQAAVASPPPVRDNGGR